MSWQPGAEPYEFAVIFITVRAQGHQAVRPPGDARKGRDQGPGPVVVMVQCVGSRNGDIHTVPVSAARAPSGTPSSSKS
ncbi:MAG: hypothetical protein MZU91_13055 [Desulfosudis oleivorans]|nr:hypothetical protein [Desulfosudis oleivorans]